MEDVQTSVLLAANTYASGARRMTHAQSATSQDCQPTGVRATGWQGDGHHLAQRARVTERVVSASVANDRRRSSLPRPGPGSLIDRVDDLNHAIGTVPRAKVFDEGANFRTVHVLVFNHSGSVLLQQLSASRDRSPLQWGSSVAGYLHAGETYYEAARRRLAEELGLRTPLRRVGVTMMPDDGVKKFVGVYTTIADSPHISEPDHIAQLEFVPPNVVEADIVEDPARYTDTLKHVLCYVITVQGSLEGTDDRS
jgi:isopentenyl-diphosphate delta-isomerase